MNEMIKETYATSGRPKPSHEEMLGMDGGGQGRRSWGPAETDLPLCAMPATRAEEEHEPERGDDHTSRCSYTSKVRIHYEAGLHSPYVTCRIF